MRQPVNDPRAADREEALSSRRAPPGAVSTAGEDTVNTIAEPVGSLIVDNRYTIW